MKSTNCEKGFESDLESNALKSQDMEEPWEEKLEKLLQYSEVWKREKETWEAFLELVSSGMKITIKYPLHEARLKREYQNGGTSKIKETVVIWTRESEALAAVEAAVLGILAKHVFNFEKFFIRYVCKPVWEEDERTGIETGKICLGRLFVDLHVHLTVKIRRGRGAVTVTATMKPVMVPKEEFEKLAFRCERCGKLYNASKDRFHHCDPCGRLVCNNCFDFEIGVLACLDCAPKVKEEEDKWLSALKEEGLKEGE